jgi:hypothetical protein
MRKFIIYIVSLAVASVVVFIFFFTFGRRPSLEQELARRTALQRPPDISLSIPSLKPMVPEGAEEAVEVLTPPKVHAMSEDIEVARYPLEEAGMLMLLDGQVLAPADGAAHFSPSGFRQGLERFIDRLPANIQLGLRSLAGGFKGDCSGTLQLQPCGFWSPVELRNALGSAAPSGSRSLSRGLEDAAADLAGVPGEQAIIILTGGDEECGGAPCQVAASLKLANPQLKIFVIVLRSSEVGWQVGEMPPPLWQSRMECLAERGEGALFQAGTGDELEEILLRIASSIQPNLTVRALHSAEREVTGIEVEQRNAWGASISTADYRGGRREVKNSFPAVFSLPEGEYELLLWYRGQERRLEGLNIAARERVEVKVNFRSGELYVEAKDVGGEELVGATGGFDCFWGVEIFDRDDLDRDSGTACSFPAYFVLSPGSYIVRAWKGTTDVWVENVKIVEGETTVKDVVFRGE